MINLADSALGRISSGFGYRNTGIPGASKNHRGIDIILSDYDIPAVQAGTVVENAYNSLRGYYITIQHADGTKTRYQHMKRASPLWTGSAVSEGQIIGVMGSSGKSSGDHLHFEVMGSDGNYLNPIDYLSGGTSSYTKTPTTKTLGDVVTGTGFIQDKAEGILSVVIKGLSFLALAILAAYMFFMAFDIKIKKG